MRLPIRPGRKSEICSRSEILRLDRAILGRSPNAGNPAGAVTVTAARASLTPPNSAAAYRDRMIDRVEPELLERSAMLDRIRAALVERFGDERR